FRGLRSVHSRYGLPARGTAQRSFPSKASAGSLLALPLRWLPAAAKVAGWNLHPLKEGAFARRTLSPFFHERGRLVQSTTVPSDSAPKPFLDGGVRRP